MKHRGIEIAEELVGGKSKSPPRYFAAYAGWRGSGTVDDIRAMIDRILGPEMNLGIQPRFERQEPDSE